MERALIVKYAGLLEPVEIAGVVQVADDMVASGATASRLSPK